MKSDTKRVIAAISVGTMLVGSSIIFSACNRDIIDTNYTYDYAIIDTHDGVIRVPIKQWRDYDDGDQIQIISADDGTVYLTNTVNCTLVNEP